LWVVASVIASRLHPIGANHAATPHWRPVVIRPSAGGYESLDGRAAVPRGEMGVPLGHRHSFVPHQLPDGV